jgi:hypothetical protein
VIDLKRIKAGGTPTSHLLNLLEHHWREQNELAKLLHCQPQAVHSRLCELAESAHFTVICAGGAFAVLRAGWAKKDLLRLIRGSLHE